MNYALINDGIIINIIYLSPSNASDFPNAVPMKDYPVGIGDTYDGQYFYRNGERILSPLEEANLKIEELEAYYSAIGGVIE